MRFPIDSYLSEIAGALLANKAVLLKAEPGAGKTTQVPRYLLDRFKKILVVEPRRLAAKLSAEWVAEQCGSKVGELVGYQIRLESRKTSATRLVYVTEGILTRLFMQDPALSEYDLVILDEFHERHVHSDIALTLVKKLQETREDLRLLVMSATLEQTLLQSFLGNVPSFDVPGRVFPVAVSCKPFPHDTPVTQKVASAVLDMLEDKACEGNILVFLAGMGQIHACANYLEGRLPEDVEVIPLSAEHAGNYGRIVANPLRKKVILSTNVAETSLTLPNIQGVIDNGSARILSFAPWSGLPTLEEKKVSQASCIQRSGRAGRVTSGVCYRLFSEADFHARAKFSEPEIQRIDLCQILLELASLAPEQSWDVDRFNWLQKPREATLRQNLELLQNLGAIKESRLTDLGRRMAKVALHPRLSKIWFEAETKGISELGLLAALVINEGMILEKDQKPDEHSSSDVLYQLQVLLDLAKKKPRRVRLDMAAVQRLRQTYDQLSRGLKLRSISDLSIENEQDLLHAVYLGFADRVAKHRPLADQGGKRKQRHYNFALGRGAVLSDSSSAQNCEWIVAVEAHESYDENLGRIFAASGVHPDFLLGDPFALVTHVDEIKIDPKAGRARRCQQVLYGKLLIEERWEDTRSEDAQDILLNEVRKVWPNCFEDLEAIQVYHRKLELLDKASVTHELPRFEGEMLELLMDYMCEDVSSLRELKKKSLRKGIEEQLSYVDQQFLKTQCPDMITLAAGRQLKVNYHDEAEPFIASKIQDFFLQKETPAIIRGRYPLLLKLLAPSQRPAQITRDLKGFWAGSYHEVKKDLKRRYPKQAWPDDPANFVMPKREDRRG